MNPLIFLPLDIENIIRDYVRQLEEHEKKEKIKCRIRHCLLLRDLKQYFIRKHEEKERDWVEGWRIYLDNLIS